MNTQPIARGTRQVGPSTRSAMWMVRLIAVLALGAQLTGCALVDFEQRRWIFQPTDSTWAPGLAAAEGMEDVWIDHVSQHPEHPGAAVRLHGLWLAHPEASALVVLFLHGVRWDVRARAPRMRQLHALGFSVLGVDYRGFGHSSSVLPSESLVAEDARAAWEWMALRHPSAARFIFGHSLGAAVAVRLAQEVDNETGVIFEGAFTSNLDVLRSTSWGWLLVGWMITAFRCGFARGEH